MLTVLLTGFVRLPLLKLILTRPWPLALAPHLQPGLQPGWLLGLSKHRSNQCQWLSTMPAPGAVHPSCLSPWQRLVSSMRGREGVSTTVRAAGTAATCPNPAGPSSWACAAVGDGLRAVDGMYNTVFQELGQSGINPTTYPTPETWLALLETYCGLAVCAVTDLHCTLMPSPLLLRALGLPGAQDCATAWLRAGAVSRGEKATLQRLLCQAGTALARFIGMPQELLVWLQATNPATAAAAGSRARGSGSSSRSGAHQPKEPDAGTLTQASCLLQRAIVLLITLCLNEKQALRQSRGQYPRYAQSQGWPVTLLSSLVSAAVGHQAEANPGPMRSSRATVQLPRTYLHLVMSIALRRQGEMARENGFGCASMIRAQCSKDRAPQPCGVCPCATTLLPMQT